MNSKKKPFFFSLFFSFSLASSLPLPPRPSCFVPLSPFACRKSDLFPRTVSSTASPLVRTPVVGVPEVGACCTDSKAGRRRYQHQLLSSIVCPACRMSICCFSFSFCCLHSVYLFIYISNLYSFNNKFNDLPQKGWSNFSSSQNLIM